MHPLTITRTVYDPATRDFVFDSAESKALPSIRQWINNKNPVIYWYILRVDNQSELPLDQWAIELYTHQALNITEAYIDGIDRCFELKKRENDSWTEKYVLSIPQQLGIPIVGKGTRRILFKVDINCREGLMHKYGISGRFIAQGVEAVDIKEKFFQYSCKVGEFKQIFDKTPDQASIYAEKRLSTRYSDNDIHLFTNSFRMIHDLYRYCHSGSIQKDELMHKLHLLYANFEMVPDIAEDKINPLLYDGIRELELIRNIDNFKPRYIRLCDSLVELLHIEVMGTNPGNGAIAAQENKTPSYRTDYVNGDDKVSRDGRPVGTGNRECPVCKNIIDLSNKSIICKQCGSRFCQTCESCFREPRKPGESVLCEKCFAAERDEKIRMERERARHIKEDEQKKALETEKQRKEEEPASTQVKRTNIPTTETKNSRKFMFIPVVIIIVLAGYWMFSPLLVDNSYNQDTVVPQNTKVVTSSLAGTDNKTITTAGSQENMETYINSIGMEFVLIPSGEFEMGSNGGDSDEVPVHEVTIKKAYYLGKYEVTQEQWVAVMGNNPSYLKGDSNPVERVSWNDVQEFVKKLNAKEGTDKYRLPSEAEWEYACRAGTTTEYSFGNNESELEEYAWYIDNLEDKTNPVGQKKPNPWGLYDMYGNVWEWCQDRYHYSYNGAPTDGSAWEDGRSSRRVSRGGGWDGYASDRRSANRDNGNPDIGHINLGFRLLMEA